MIQVAISVIIPLHNEEGNVKPLLDELYPILQKNFLTFEIILIDDASSDHTQESLSKYKNSNIKIIINDKNLGQGHSILIGCQSSKYETIVTMDGDLQVSPLDILKLYRHKEMYNLDFVASKRKMRKADNPFSHLPSLLGNIFIKALYKVDLIDVGSSLKVLPRSEIIHLPKHKNIHRYISIFLHFRGLSYEEVDITCRERLHGSSKYNSLKFLRAFFEIVTLRIYLKKYINNLSRA